jgi:hypothetical protein
MLADGDSVVAGRHRLPPPKFPLVIIDVLGILSRTFPKVRGRFVHFAFVLFNFDIASPARRVRSAVSI